MMRLSETQIIQLLALAAIIKAANAQAQTCSSSKDCDKQSYCASGTCLPIVQCKTREDCFNPDNGPYPAVYCVGYMECNLGYCEMNCNGEFCAPGQDFVACEEEKPCDVEPPCEEAVSCYNENCGGCRAIWYDAAGYQVCQDVVDDVTSEPEEAGVSEATSVPSDEESTIAPTLNSNPELSLQLQPCTCDVDCLTMAVERSIEGDFYCGRGFCLEVGTCGIDADCDNPKNNYDSVFCVGYNRCEEDGVCSRVCGPPCPNEEDEDICQSDPCLEASCSGSTSCRSSQCGGCSAIFYDAAGNVMIVCSGDDEAMPESFIPQGIGSTEGSGCMRKRIVGHLWLTAMALLAIL